jgi:hypothetical protein
MKIYSGMFDGQFQPARRNRKNINSQNNSKKSKQLASLRKLVHRDGRRKERK